MKALITAQQHWAVHYTHIHSISANHTNIAIPFTSTRATSLLHSSLQTELHASAPPTTAQLILLDPFFQTRDELGNCLVASKLHCEKKIVYADIKHTVMGSNGAAFLYTDDALCRAKIDVNLQVLIFRHENFTMNRFTTWRSAVKKLWRESVEWA